MTSTSSLAGKRVLATGGSRGIGAAIVRRIASQGATVTVNYRSDKAGAVVSESGGLDLLVSNAGGEHFTVTRRAWPPALSTPPSRLAARSGSRPSPAVIPEPAPRRRPQLGRGADQRP